MELGELRGDETLGFPLYVSHGTKLICMLSSKLLTGSPDWTLESLSCTMLSIKSHL